MTVKIITARAILTGKNVVDKQELKQALEEILTPELLAEALKIVFTPDRIKAMTRGSLTIKQAAIYQGVSVERIREKIISGELEYVTENGRKRILKSVLDKIDAERSGRRKQITINGRLNTADRLKEKWARDAKSKGVQR